MVGVVIVGNIAIIVWKENSFIFISLSISFLKVSMPPPGYSPYLEQMSWRRWNEEFQRSFEEVIDSSAIIIQRQRFYNIFFRAKILYQNIEDYLIWQMILCLLQECMEKSLFPRDICPHRFPSFLFFFSSFIFLNFVLKEKTIKPNEKLGGVAGGDKYIHQVLFLLALFNTPFLIFLSFFPFLSEGNSLQICG